MHVCICSTNSLLNSSIDFDTGALENGRNDGTVKEREGEGGGMTQKDWSISQDSKENHISHQRLRTFALTKKK